MGGLEEDTGTGTGQDRIYRHVGGLEALSKFIRYNTGYLPPCGRLRSLCTTP
ncbi:hypothetical protein CCP3SC15_940011 [Gammaproteobacteria bacterium]